jgi:hypothetical protein
MPKGDHSDRTIEHVLRRAGFGARPDELDQYRGMSLTQAVDALVDYETVPDDVDQNLGKPGFVGTPSGGGFSDRQSTSSYERHQATVRQRRRSR